MTTFRTANLCKTPKIGHWLMVMTYEPLKPANVCKKKLKISSETVA